MNEAAERAGWRLRENSPGFPLLAASVTSTEAARSAASSATVVRARGDIVAECAPAAAAPTYMEPPPAAEGRAARVGSAVTVWVRPRFSAVRGIVRGLRSAGASGALVTSQKACPPPRHVAEF